MNGLYAEQSGIAFKKNDYIEENDLLDIVKIVRNLVDDPTKEHLLYTLGITLLKQKPLHMGSHLMKSLFTNEHDFQKYRFHRLVKIGAVIENHGLTTLNKATMIGAFTYIAMMHKNAL